MRGKSFLVYRDYSAKEQKLLDAMVQLAEGPSMDHTSVLTDSRALLHDCIFSLVEEAASLGFYGNLWHCFLTNLLVNNENSYSMACEIRGEVNGSINDLVLHDIRIFQGLFAYNLEEMGEKYSVPEIAILKDYKPCDQASKVYNSRIRDRICNLAIQLGEATDVVQMKNVLTEFYGQYGVGKFGLHKAFRVVHDENNEIQIVPIRNIAHVKLDDLVGYDIPKKKLVDNTEAFVSKRRANNCLLFGDAGTGKSSSIKAISNEYYERGLRIIEVYKHQFKDLNGIISQIKARNYRFIIYMDDLSFEEFETDYKYLKAVIEGGLEKKPENVLIYATSNRRHLVREVASDKDDRRIEDMHSGDTVQEKLSLAYRFGVSIFFEGPSKKEFQQIVRVLAERNHIMMPEEELLLEANKWELSHGGLSGRTAQQFIDYLLGKPAVQNS